MGCFVLYCLFLVLFCAEPNVSDNNWWGRVNR